MALAVNWQQVLFRRKILKLRKREFAFIDTGSRSAGGWWREGETDSPGPDPGSAGHGLRSRRQAAHPHCPSAFLRRMGLMIG